MKIQPIGEIKYMKKSYELPRDRFVYPICLPVVQLTLAGSTLLDVHYDSADKKDKKDRFNEVVLSYREWLKPVLDLSNFNYVYPTNGITHGIDQWLMNETRKIQVFKGEYGWVKLQRNDIVEIEDVSEIDPTGVLYFSNPFSATGNFDPRWEEILDIGVPIILDAAFVGTTAIKNIPLNKNVEQVFVGLSKPFGLGHFRIGYTFAKSWDKSLSSLTDIGYFNLLIPHLTEKIINEFEIDWLHNILQKTQMIICQDLQLDASDCVLLGLSTDRKYRFYSRGNGINRICLSQIYESTGLL